MTSLAAQRLAILRGLTPADVRVERFTGRREYETIRPSWYNTDDDYAETDWVVVEYDNLSLFLVSGHYPQTLNNEIDAWRYQEVDGLTVADFLRLAIAHLTKRVAEERLQESWAAAYAAGALYSDWADSPEGKALLCDLKAIDPQWPFNGPGERRAGSPDQVRQ